jgi:hypothetical protein
LPKNNSLKISINCEKINLYEVGNIINEDKINSVKVWKKTQTNTGTIFLYVLNNYWHTNYKAAQEGKFDFEVSLKFE